MNTDIIAKIEKSQLKKRPEIQIGDSVKMHMKIKEGDKERTQIFEGIVIAMKGSSLNKTVTVRKMSYGVGVERVIPLHANTLDKVEVLKRGKVRRSKLYYVRDRVGKRALKVNKIEDVYMTDEVEQKEEEVVDGGDKMEKENVKKDVDKKAEPKKEVKKEVKKVEKKKESKKEVKTEEK